MHAQYGDEVPGTQAPVTLLPTAEKDDVAPLPRWLTAIYFLFPVVIYIPDVIFNYFVYSDGLHITSGNPALQAGQMVLWGFLSVGVVGMAYLLSVLAPWHWGKRHHLQAIFCVIGMLIAMSINTWNSLSFRSTTFVQFPTDIWLYGLFPQLATYRISFTMFVIALSPPFWGLFWAAVQPTQCRRDTSEMRANQEAELLRIEHDANVKAAKARANAKVRAAQLAGLAQTAVAARTQAGQVFRKPGEHPTLAEQSPYLDPHSVPAASSTVSTTSVAVPSLATDDETTDGGESGGHRRKGQGPGRRPQADPPATDYPITMQRVPHTGLQARPDDPQISSPLDAKTHRSDYVQVPGEDLVQAVLRQ